MSATIHAFPKQSRRKRVWVHGYREGEPLPTNVAARRIDYAPPPQIERSAELLMLMALLKALPPEVREQVRCTVRATAAQYGDKPSLIAKHVMALLS